jgi:hypothetical protein
MDDRVSVDNLERPVLRADQDHPDPVAQQDQPEYAESLANEENQDHAVKLDNPELMASLAPGERSDPLVQQDPPDHLAQLVLVVNRDSVANQDSVESLGNQVPQAQLVPADQVAQGVNLDCLDPLVQQVSPAHLALGVR